MEKKKNLKFLLLKMKIQNLKNILINFRHLYCGILTLLISLILMILNGRYLSCKIYCFLFLNILDSE